MIRRHSRDPAYDPSFSLPDELERRGLLRLAGRHRTAPVEWRQPVASYVEALHSTATLARELMPAAEAAVFDWTIAEVVAPHADDDGMLTLVVTASIAWGEPVVEP